MAEIISDPRDVRPTSYVEWAPIWAGAVGAASVSLLLLTFGSAIGLTAVSPWPNSGLPIAVVAIIGVLWLLAVQIGSFAAGGYLAGRLRAPVSNTATSERQFRDGAHGFLVWGLGSLLGVLALAATTGSIVGTSVNAASNVAGGAASVAGAVLPGTESAVDLLLRGSSQASAPSPDLRSELNRLVSKAVDSGALPAADREYLTGIVATRSGASPADAQQKVDNAFAAALNAQAKARAAADTARKSAALAAFAAAASLLVSLVAASAGAGLGGRHRDEGTPATLLGANRLW